MEKNYIYSPSLNQGLCQKLIKGFSNHIPINVIEKSVKEEDLDLVIDEKGSYKVFEKSNTEIGSLESKSELKFPQDYEDKISR